MREICPLLHDVQYPLALLPGVQIAVGNVLDFMAFRNKEMQCIRREWDSVLLTDIEKLDRVWKRLVERRVVQVIREEDLATMSYVHPQQFNSYR